MPEATILYVVAAVVVAGLIVWVAAVLMTAKESWSRPAPMRAAAAEGAVPTDPDTTAKATPVALGNTKPEPSKDEVG
jgi:hypothetical protein